MPYLDFGIVLAFGIGFITLLLIFTEFNTSLSGSSNVTLFKRGSKAPVIREAAAAVGSDEEKAQVAQEAGAPDTADTAEEEKAISQGPKMNDAFSWQHLNYTVPVADGKRQLLNDVSGYVVPGQLTALMGESGAGKVRAISRNLIMVFTVRTDDAVECACGEVQHWRGHWRSLCERPEPSAGFPGSNVS
jgi:ATP-binding cassette subfamily G (WHITE) protein 2 (SNQ2)